MSQITISKSVLNGSIEIPASKSIFQRACAAAVLKQGATVIKNCGYSNDDKAAIEIIKTLGTQAVFVGTSAIFKFEPKIEQVTETVVLDCNESGLSSRMFMPVVNTIFYSSKFIGEGSLTKRPFQPLIDALKALGIEVYDNNGSLPIRLEGNLLPQDITVDGSSSSQFLTGLLLAFSSFSLSEPVTITVTNLVSKPYIDLTLQVIASFQLNTPQNDAYQTFTFHPKPLELGQQLKYTVEGDWSAGIAVLVAGAMCGEVIAEGIDAFTLQGDKQILQALMEAGVRTSIESDKVTASQASLKAFHYNAIDTPDAFPVLAALATQCEGTSIIEGVHRLVHKESNRAEVILQTLTTCGVDASIQDDMLVIKGKTAIKGGLMLSSAGDHRIAMMITLLGMVAEEPIVLTESEVIAKSFPSYYESLIKVGANIQQH